jgi:hypothetical protein
VALDRRGRIDARHLAALDLPRDTDVGASPAVKQRTEIELVSSASSPGQQPKS